MAKRVSANDRRFVLFRAMFDQRRPAPVPACGLGAGIVSADDASPDSALGRAAMRIRAARSSPASTQPIATPVR
jgi:hypothetical protein